MKPIVGFGAVVLTLDTSEFNGWMKTIGLDRESNLEDFEEIFIMAQNMVSLYQTNNAESTFTKKDFAKLTTINGEE